PQTTSGLSGFRTGQVSGVNLAPMRIVKAAVQFVQSAHLRGRQALLGILARLALDGSRIEVTLARVVDDAVPHAVDRVARVVYRVGNRGDLRGSNETRGIRGERLGIVGSQREQAGPIVRRCPGENTVVVFGIALRFHQRLASTIGTAREV